VLSDDEKESVKLGRNESSFRNGKGGFSHNMASSRLALSLGVSGRPATGIVVGIAFVDRFWTR
jgi:hypothetical protein